MSKRSDKRSPVSLSATDFDLRIAVALHHRGQLIEAEQIYQNILRVVPAHFDALHMLGVLKHKQGRNEEAIELISAALHVKPTEVGALSNYGVVLNELKRFDEALASLDRVITLRPNFAEAHYNRGIALQGLKRFDEALRSYNNVIALKPDNPEAFNNRGNTLKELEILDEALASYNTAIALRPRYAEAFNNRGIALSELKRFDEALASYEKAIALRPDDAGAFNSRGNALMALRRLDEALASFDKAITLKQDFAEAFNNRGIVLRELKHFDEALASYDRAISLRPDYAEAFHNRGNALNELMRFDEALASCDTAIALEPSFAEAFNSRGNALKELKRFDEALASYDKAIALKPNDAAAFNNRSIALVEVGRLAEAQWAAEKAIEFAPRKARYYRTLGDVVRFGSGDPRVAAMEVLSRDAALLSVDDRIELHFALAKAYEDLGRHADAFCQWLDGSALKRRQITYSEATTLGAMNYARAMFTSDFMRTWQNVGNPSSVPIFIVGMPRSGTTLVEQILASHPEVFGGGELTHFRRAAEECRPTIGGSGSFAELVSGMIGEQFQKLGSRYLTEIQKLAPTAARITDKMIGNFIYAGLIHLALPNAPILHVTRNPIDTCISCFSKIFGSELNYTYDLAELGRYYRHYEALMAHWHLILPPDRIFEVSYEDVVSDLEGQARRIVAHCALEWDTRCLAFYQTKRPVLTPSATQVRQPIYNSAIGRWRVHEAFLGPLLAELGIAGNLN